jgi:hypothetical protein
MVNYLLIKSPTSVSIFNASFYFTEYVSAIALERYSVFSPYIDIVLLRFKNTKGFRFTIPFVCGKKNIIHGAVMQHELYL